MYLVSAEVKPFRSINTPQVVNLDEKVTALVGMNEAGKTVFLKALEKSRDALDSVTFDHIEDFPRKDLPAYLKLHSTAPATAVVSKYKLNAEEITQINNEFHTELKADFTFTINYLYNNSQTIGIEINERPVIEAYKKKHGLSLDAAKILDRIQYLSEVPTAFKEITPNANDAIFLAEIEKKIKANSWRSLVAMDVYQWLSKRLPKFLYFGDYEILPSKMNLKYLAGRVEAAKKLPKDLDSEQRGVLSLLRMADISVSDFSNPGGYEELKAKIEGVSISLTDQIMEFWKQNENLEVEIDVKNDPNDIAPFNDGPNLYLRIKNRRHRGVSTPFKQRSRGFIWFFSFLVWFDDVLSHLNPTGAREKVDLILLLDEPGLNLHALAQSDFLKYIDSLSEKHQVIYTTHSPFMIHSDRFNQIRLVEDKEKVGTVISENLSGSDPKTIFPLQAALGWNIAQNLFIGERNLLVEGPADLIYLKAVSALLENKKLTALRDDVIIAPTGGVDKIVTFVSLLGANGLKLVVLHDYKGNPDQRITELVKEKIITQKVVLNYSMFKNDGKPASGSATDVEDLFDVDEYLQYFNGTFSVQLKGVKLNSKDLPDGDRILDRIDRYLNSKGISIRPSGGFNHYLVASYFASNPPKELSDQTIRRFQALNTHVNAVFDELDRK